MLQALPIPCVDVAEESDTHESDDAGEDVPLAGHLRQAAEEGEHEVGENGGGGEEEG